MTRSNERRLLRRGAVFFSYLAAAALTPAARWVRRRVRRRFRVVIVTYHRVAAGTPTDHLAIPVSTFAAHLDYLRRNYRIVELDTAVRALRPSSPLDEDLAVVTFDDGYRDNLTVAQPELHRRHIPAHLFVTTKFVDRGIDIPWFLAARALVLGARRHHRAPTTASSPLLSMALRPDVPANDAAEEVVAYLKTVDSAVRDRALRELSAVAGTDAIAAAMADFLDWEEVRQLDRDGFRIGSHTVSHPILARLEPTVAEIEIRDSRAILERQLGRPVTTFAYPNGHTGDFTDANVESLRRHGYEAACTTNFGFNYPGADLLRLKRIGVGDDPIALFAAKLEGILAPLYAVRERRRRQQAADH